MQSLVAIHNLIKRSFHEQFRINFKKRENILLGKCMFIFLPNKILKTIHSWSINPIYQELQLYVSIFAKSLQIVLKTLYSSEQTMLCTCKESGLSSVYVRLCRNRAFCEDEGIVLCLRENLEVQWMAPLRLASDASGI